LAAHAAALAADPDALAAVAQLGAGPLLQACRRRLAAAVLADWDEGCCPVCGAWPALAESRGLERARRLRCARCGADWGVVALRCPYCRNGDHQQLGSLVSETQGEGRKVDTCDRCRGYVKSVATLRPWAADEVALADLATVDLDLAALDHDFARPDAPAVALDLRLVDPSAAADPSPE
jgi:FdhE protein